MELPEVHNIIAVRSSHANVLILFYDLARYAVYTLDYLSMSKRKKLLKSEPRHITSSHTNVSCKPDSDKDFCKKLFTDARNDAETWVSTSS